jgi:hypothetical protein
MKRSLKTSLSGEKLTMDHFNEIKESGKEDNSFNTPNLPPFRGAGGFSNYFLIVISFPEY